MFEKGHCASENRTVLDFLNRPPWGGWIWNTKKFFFKTVIFCSPKGGFFKKSNTVLFSEAQMAIVQNNIFFGHDFFFLTHLLSVT